MDIRSFASTRLNDGAVVEPVPRTWGVGCGHTDSTVATSSFADTVIAIIGAIHGYNCRRPGC